MVDVSRYAKSKYIKADDVRDGSFVEQIAVVTEDKKFDRLVLIFENGRQVSLNQTSVGNLMKEFGEDSDSWKWKKVRLSLGTYETKDGVGEMVIVDAVEADDADSVVALTEKKMAAPPKKAASAIDEFGDKDIPF
jgi:hypothetical protein